MKKLFNELKTYKGFYLMLIFVPILSVLAAYGIVQYGHYAWDTKYENNLNYGYASLDAGEYTEAITAFEEAYRMESSYEAAVGLAKAWFGTGDAEKAVQILAARSELYEPTEEMDTLMTEYKITLGIYPKVTIGGREIEINSTSIFINDTPLTEEDKAKLAEFTDLVTVDLTNCELTDIEFLRNCDKLMSVTLTNNPIKDFTPLQNKPDLRTLYINDTAIEDYSQLHEMTGLSVLNNNGNWITAEQDAALYEALPDCEIYSGLNGYLIFEVTINGTTYLSDEKTVTLSGVGLSDVTPLTQFSAVTTLDISNNRISWITPMTDMVTVSKLDMSGNRISNISALAELNRLKVLNLNDNAVTDLSPLTDKTKLTELYLNGNPIYHGHAALSTLTKLTKLHLQDSLLKDEHLSLLPMETLTELDLRSNKSLSEAAVLDLVERYPDCTIYSDYTD